jgi:hypothetical protein
MTRMLVLLLAALLGQVSANQQCVGCFAACCGSVVAVCGGTLAWWNPPAFHVCAASNCGGTCNHLCNAHCYPAGYGR